MHSACSGVMSDSSDGTTAGDSVGGVMLRAQVKESCGRGRPLHLSEGHAESLCRRIQHKVLVQVPIGSLEGYRCFYKQIYPVHSVQAFFLDASLNL